MAFNRKTSMYEGFVYLITNKVNGKKYIGQTTTDIVHRFKQHIQKAKHCNYAICSAIRKYGKDNFTIEEIEKIEKTSKKELVEELNIIEKKYIFEYKTLTSQYGYNIDIGGASCSYFVKAVDTYDLNGTLIHTFDSMNETARFYNIDVNIVVNICKGVQNRCMSHDVIFRYHGDPFDKYDTKLLIPNTKPLYCFTLYGKFVGEYISAPDAIAKLKLDISSSSLSRAARYNSVSCGYVWSYEKVSNFDIENYRNYVPVDKYSLEGEFLGSYKSTTDAGKSLELDYVKTSCITDVCSGKMVTAYGYIWRYKDEPFDKFKTKYSYKPVNQYTDNNIYVKTHINALQASKDINLKYSGDIGKCCKERKGHCGGYKWFYADDLQQPDKSKIINL